MELDGIGFYGLNRRNTCGYFLEHNKLARSRQHFDQFPVVLLGKRHGSLFRLLYELATKLLDRFTTVMGSGFSDASEDFSDFKSYSGCPQSTSEEVPRQISAGNAETEVGMWGRTGHLNCFGTTSVFGL